MPGRTRGAQRLARVMNDLIAAERWPEAEVTGIDNMPPFFAPVSRLLRSGGFVAHIASRGPTTPFYTSAEKLAEGFARHGLETVASGAAGPGTYYLARRP